MIKVTILFMLNETKYESMEYFNKFKSSLKKKKLYSSWR